MTLHQTILESAWTRIGLGFAAMGAIIAGLPQPIGSTVDIERLIAVVLAVGLWLAAEIRSGRTVHPHDQKLFEKFSNTVSKNERLELLEQDMGASFRFNNFAGTSTIRETWKGPSHSFQDKKLQVLWQSCLLAVDQFYSKLLMHTGPMPGNYGVATVKTAEDFRTGERSQETLQNAIDLNEAASALCEAYDLFEYEAIKRLRISA